MPKHVVRQLDTLGERKGHFFTLLEMTEHYNAKLATNARSAANYWQHRVVHKFDRMGYERQSFEALSWAVDCYLNEVNNAGMEPSYA